MVLSPLVTIPDLVPGLGGMFGLAANVVAIPAAMATTALTILAGALSARMPFWPLKLVVRLAYLALVWLSLSTSVRFASRRAVAAGRYASGQVVDLNGWLLQVVRGYFRS